MRNKLITIIILAALLAGCAPSPAPVDIQPLVDAAVAQTMEAQQQVADSVAQTVAAQVPLSTPTAVSAATAEASPTAVPTLELVPLIPDTPVPPVDQPADTPEPAPIQPAYACNVFTITPELREEVKAGSQFKIKWMIINSGTRPWDAGVDVKYSDGVKMTVATSVEIPNKMNPGDSYTVILNATAPAQKGRYYMTWMVEGQLCYPSVIIDSK
ncbi:MAG: hypothetical protein HY864_05625 [Chloroflexi bacterium]|nr:hypothetical protein [Chloroflexota bacterium]